VPQPKGFPEMRQEAEETLRKVLAPQAHPDDTMEMVNVESRRAQAFARLDCLCVQWLDEAFREVDRVQRWADVRAEVLARIQIRHAPEQTDEGVWICQECCTFYPCNTRKDLGPQLKAP
jgi:hypothetical protein